MDLESSFGGVMVCGESVGGSSRLGRIATTRRNRDGWWRFVTACQFVIDIENIYGGVMDIENMFSVFLSSYRNTRGTLGEREMSWEYKPQATVSTAFFVKQQLSRNIFFYLRKERNKLLELGLRDPGNRKKMDFHKHYFFLN